MDVVYNYTSAQLLQLQFSRASYILYTNEINFVFGRDLEKIPFLKVPATIICILVQIMFWGQLPKLEFPPYISGIRRTIVVI